MSMTRRLIYENKDGVKVRAFFKDGERDVLYSWEEGVASSESKEYWSQFVRLQGLKLISSEVIS